MPVLSTLKNTWNEMSSTEKLAVAGISSFAVVAGGVYWYNKRQQSSASSTTAEQNVSPYPSSTKNNSPAFFLKNNSNVNTNNTYSPPSFDEGVDGRYIATLTEEELAKWLSARGLPRADVDALCHQHHVDGAVFIRLTPELVDEMKLPSVGGRLRLGQLVMRCRESFHSQPPTPRRVDGMNSNNSTNFLLGEQLLTPMSVPFNVLNKKPPPNKKMLIPNLTSSTV